MPKPAVAFASLVAFALWIALPSVAIGAQQGERELYRWLDRHGVVRYTTDLSRIPNARRDTVVRVVPPSMPTANSSVAPAAPVAGVDPFNSPAQVPQADAQDDASDSAVAGSSWPELDARIAELEVLVAKDEEAIKEMISKPQTGEHDELIDSEELREIGARLPVLQGELAELKSWRDDPDTR
ncbi:MAG: hypothetical protein ACYS0F_07010 [Planctomycetota bacterium]|jgi:uncharacterized coiled-coil protein SlyX